MIETEFGQLGRAIQRLEEGLATHRAAPDDDLVRDGLIQRFEFTYDLACKTLRRVVIARSANADLAAAMSFPELIRAADEQNLLAHGWSAWKRYREQRNITSHTYDLEKAREVASRVPEFLAEAKELAGRLAGLAER
jgi:nucleotidyltransferase substrate binding protein (TIGR01987 family)